MIYKSPNFSSRTLPIDSVIMHHSGGKAPGFIRWLCMPESKVSAHICITKNLEVYQIVDFSKKAWHAGRGAFDLDADGKISAEERLWNDRSIGIELENFTPYSWPNVFEEFILCICLGIAVKFGIKPGNFLGHKEIAPKRKIDPYNFDMNIFRNRLRNYIGW